MEAARTLVPAWEWRAFDRRFAVAEARFAALAATAVQESEELYLLAPTERARAKLRDGRLELEVLGPVEGGLEQWISMLQAGFPMEATAVRETFAALDLPQPDLLRERYQLEPFLAELALPAGLRSLAVRQRRERYEVCGCRCEVSHLSVDGQPLCTIAVESQDATAVIAALRAMGLDGYANTSYPRALHQFLEGAPARYAVLDVGTNSVKFQLAERSRAGVWRTLVDRAQVTRLGEDLHARGVLVPAALERTAAAIADMAEEARRHGARAIAALGTAALRNAGNAAEAIETIRRRAGVTVEVVSGDEEARLSYLAAQSGLALGDDPVVVFETGGGSSQFTFGRGTRVDERFSLEVGAARTTERFGLDGAVSRETLDSARAAIAADLTALDDRQPPQTLVALGGAVTSMAAVQHQLATYDADVVHGAQLERREVERQIALYAARDADARRAIVGLDPKRAEVILAGACIVESVMLALGMHTATVCERGLRHGLLAERFGP